MNKPAVRARLLAVVPELTAPADRLGQVRRRASRRQAVKVLTVAVAAGLALTAVGGALNLSPTGSGRTDAFGTDPNIASTREPGTGVTKSVKARPGRGPYAASELVGPDRCPEALDLIGPRGVDVVEPRAGSADVRHVTVCRYKHEDFNLSVGDATLLDGPRRADPRTVAEALVPILNPPPSNWNSAGCRMPSPTRNVTVDIVYVVDADGSASVHSLMRITCDNPWPADPYLKLRAAVDATMGAPY
jgi:hypothetical protein